jgi:tRNA(Ile)-lysidine synthase
MPDVGNLGTLLGDNDFAALMAALPLGALPPAIAVAVSGGGDSMALLHLLARWAKNLGGPRVKPGGKGRIEIHVLTVDHGLRPESKAEALQVAAWVHQLPVLGLNHVEARRAKTGVPRTHRSMAQSQGPCAEMTHTILTWRGVKPKTKISETARAKRYELMANYCRQHNIHHLFLAHTLDDQAETFMLRLAAGSGLDGLAAMQPVTTIKDDIHLCRPLLSVTHDQLLATLRAVGQDWIEDPTNQNLDYARPRLRAARDVLEREGLTPKRLATTAMRLGRARLALAWAADQAWIRVKTTATGLELDRVIWATWPGDVQIRVLARAVQTMGGKAARLEQIEALWHDYTVASPSATIRRTLAGAIVTLGPKRLTLKIEP